MSFKKLFLPVGLVLAAVVSILWPDGGTAARNAGLVPWAAIIIFLINGYNMRMSDFPRELKFPLMLVYLLIVSLFAAAWLAVGIGSVFGLTAAAAMGLIVMSAVPPTLSSGIVITEVSGGNTLWALVTTIGLNFLGVFTLPLVIGMTAAAAVEVEISSLALLIKLTKLVLVPLLVGWGVKKYVTRGWQLPAAVRYIPSTCVIATVWMTLSKGRADLVSLSLSSFALLAAAAITVHVTLLVVNFLGSHILRLPGDKAKAMLFVGSQKTLPVALTVLDAISAQLDGGGLSLGRAVIVCVIFHFMQLVLDSAIAARMSNIDKATGEAGGEASSEAIGEAATGSGGAAVGDK